jgi:hypothetical protein
MTNDECRIGNKELTADYADFTDWRGEEGMTKRGRAV